MQNYGTFRVAISEIIDDIYTLATSESQKRIKFIAKASRIILEGGTTGLFPDEILDLTKNLKANIDDRLLNVALSKKLADALLIFSERLDYFSNDLIGLEPSEKKAIYGLQFLMFLHKINRVTYSRLAALFIELNDNTVDMEFETFEELSGPPQNEVNEVVDEEILTPIADEENVGSSDNHVESNDRT